MINTILTILTLIILLGNTLFSYLIYIDYTTFKNRGGRWSLEQGMENRKRIEILELKTEAIETRTKTIIKSLGN